MMGWATEDLLCPSCVRMLFATDRCYVTGGVVRHPECSARLVLEIPRKPTVEERVKARLAEGLPLLVPGPRDST
jgi:hypothetical protein